MNNRHHGANGHVATNGSAFPDHAGSAATLDEAAPLSFGQRRLWFLDQMEPGSALYHVPYLVRLHGPLDQDALERSLAAIIGRHEALRTAFIPDGDEPVQVVAQGRIFRLERTDFRATNEVRHASELDRLVREEALHPFDLRRDLMLRARLFQLGETEHVLLLVLHHIAADGWSMAVLYRELGVFYTAFSSGGIPLLPELPIQYADYASWQREHLQGETLQRLVEFWRRRMADAPPLLSLPADRHRPPEQSHRGAVCTAIFPSELLARLHVFGRGQRVTLFMTLLAAFKVLLHRYTGQEDLVVGSPLAGRDRAETEGLVGLFINTLVLRTNLAGDPTFIELLGRVRDTMLAAYDYKELPFDKLVEELQPKRDLSYDPVCQVVFALQNMPASSLELPGLSTSIEPVYTGTAKADLSVWASEEPAGLSVCAEYNTDLFDAGTVERLLGHFRTILEAVVASPARRISLLPLLTPPERNRMLDDWNATEADYPRDRCVHELFAEQVERTPEATALVFNDEELTYADLNRRADDLAARLRARGVGPDTPVGLCAGRSLEMVVGLLGILKSGAAYVPLDPAYPKERLAFMLEDSGAPVLVTQHRQRRLFPEQTSVIFLDDDFDGGHSETCNGRVHPDGGSPGPESLAYILYTSGSTGRPKGVMVSHRNVLNFFAGMDRVLGGEPGVWLAVTSISFDISVLELFWTLTRGFKVVILSDQAGLSGAASSARTASSTRSLDFSLFYFASVPREACTDKYRLLIEGAKFADENGFAAVWTPERHFHSFGGLYPNPAVVGAALATVTRRVQIRAGSVVLPLHHPLRMAEEWSVVDNLSHGRVAVSFASGWHDRDFILAPQNYSIRKEVLRTGIETVKKLWRGESLKGAGGRGDDVEVRIFPRPIQPELPVWITAAGNPETFRQAGELGANVLTHLLGQSIEDLAQRIQIYRAARSARGFGEGRVTLVLHTFIGESVEAVRETVRRPFCQYLIDSVDLLNGLSRSLYPGVDYNGLSTEERETLVTQAFNRYFEGNALFGTPESCLRLINRLKAVGVDEIAGLIDFGVDTELVLKSLTSLKALKEECHGVRIGEESNRSLEEQLVRHRVTHLQCTPSFARLLIRMPDALGALRPLSRLLVGGEALPADLAEALGRVVDGEVINMYGPTETTVWSTVHKVTPSAAVSGTVEIGRPIANTQVYILDRNRQPVPAGVPGELYLGGDGLARGYWRRPELTDEKFIPHPFSNHGARLYRTGDLARYRADGVIEFLGRIDHQVKIRGHRIEPGEIEAVLARHPDVRQSVVVVRTDIPDDPRLAAYIVPGPAGAKDADTLRDFLRAKLPGHMVPDHFLFLESLPLTPNGKIDRRALPAPPMKNVATAVATSLPLAGLEQAIAAIWKDILSVENPGADDNFFDFGGHSLQVVQVQNRLRESLGVELPVIKLFQYPTIRSLAGFIGEGTKADTFLQKIHERAQRGQSAGGRRRHDHGAEVTTS